MKNRRVRLTLICFLAICLGGITACTGKTYRVNGNGMEPLFSKGNTVVAYPVNLSELRRGDVVVYTVPRMDDRTQLKRIVAVPGDTIEIKDGVLYVDGATIAEQYSVNPIPSEHFYPLVMLGPNEYFVLGDNRPASLDSRVHGPVPGEMIQGRVLVEE